jgi:hypothetical protein
VRYFALEGEVDRAKLGAVLAKLSEEDGEHRVLDGPKSANSRPGQSFLALEVPVQVEAKAIAKALKKSCKGVDELAWTSFEGVSTSLPSILGQSPRDCVIGMASPMRWFESIGDRKHFFYVADKLDADEIAGRFHTLYQPFEAGEIGSLRNTTVRIGFEPPEKESSLAKALKALGKLEGVRNAEIEGTEVVVTVELEGQRRSRPPATSEGQGSAGSEPAFDAETIRAELVEHGVVPTDT